MKLVTVEEMRDLERAADAGGHSYDAMMERAGHAVAEAIQQRADIKGKRILILVGPGNNGGDGLVAARYLARAGAHIVSYLWKSRPHEDPNMARLKEQNVDWILSQDDENSRALHKALQEADVVMDALLGTGIARPIEGELKGILEVTHKVVSQRRTAKTAGWTALIPPHPGSPSSPSIPSPLIVAVDVPSGLNCDTGAVDPVTLPADLTVTFAAAKRGQFHFPGAAVLGELAVAEIGIDPALAVHIQIEVATAESTGRLLPERPLDAHKGTFGKVMIVAGSVNYTGAPYLSAAAAGRVGAGLVTLATPERIHPILAAKLTEATYILLPHNLGVLVPEAIRVLVPRLEGYAAMLLGPGLGRERETVRFVHQLLGIAAGMEHRQIGFQRHKEPPPETAPLPPLVIDADALNALSEAEEWWTLLPENSILTPHPGEMGRLMKTDAQSVNQDRIGVARKKAGEWKQVVVLKGAFTVIAAPDGRATVIPFANPALATAGTGDVLSGAIVGLLAQGLEPFDAAVCGAYLHGLAGHIVAEQMGSAGPLAGDLLPTLPEAIRRLKQ